MNNVSVSCIQVSKENTDTLKVQILINMYKPSPHLILTRSSVSVSHPSLPVEGVRNESESSKVAEKRRQAGVGNECLNSWSTASLNAYVHVQVKLRVRRHLRPNSRSSRLGEAVFTATHCLSDVRVGVAEEVLPSLLLLLYFQVVCQAIRTPMFIFLPLSIFPSVLRARCTLRWM